MTIRIGTLTVLTIALLFSGASFGSKWTFQEIRAVGKNLLMMAGYYAQCENKGHVVLKRTSIRWNSFMANKYLAIAGIESEATKFYELGKKGYLVKAPVISEDIFSVEFSNETCDVVKNLMDTNTALVENLFIKTEGK